MSTADAATFQPSYASEQEEPLPSDLRVGVISAVSVGLGILVIAAGLLTMLAVNIFAGVLILLGAIPLWGWACVHNKALYH